MILSFTTLALLAGAAPPATQVCPDGAVILATDTCPAPVSRAATKASWAYLCFAYTSPALHAPVGYRRSWTLKRFGDELELGETGTATDYRSAIAAPSSDGVIRFKDDSGKTATAEIVARFKDDDGTNAALVEVGEGNQARLAYLCRQLDE